MKREKLPKAAAAALSRAERNALRQKITGLQTQLRLTRSALDSVAAERDRLRGLFAALGEAINSSGAQS